MSNVHKAFAVLAIALSVFGAAVIATTTVVTAAVIATPGVAAVGEETDPQCQIQNPPPWCIKGGN